MGATASLSNYAKYQFAKKQIDLSADDIRICLARISYTFNPDRVAKFINFRTNSGAISITFSNAKTITRGSGSFLTDGFIIGNKITTDSGTNPGPFTISNVSQFVITVNEAVTNEGPVTKTVSSDDELATNFGYTQYAMALTAKVLSQDDTNNWAQMVCDPVIWSASGGTIGPTPGALLIDNTLGDKTVIGYLDFGANYQALTGTNFELDDVIVRVA